MNPIKVIIAKTATPIVNWVRGPKGAKGDAATVAVGTVTTGDPGTLATVTNSGTSGNAVFDFEIPQGAEGEKGETGDKGEKGDIGLPGTTSFSGITDKPTTLSGYGITDGVNTALVGAPSGVATLDAGGKLTTGQLPDIAIVEYLGAVANQAAMLALTGQKGDWVTRTDLGSTWIITGNNPAVIGGWTQLSYPTAPVTSVAGKTGAVTLDKADVGLANVDNTSDANKPVSTAQAAADSTVATAAANALTAHSSSGGSAHPNASTSVAGFQSASDKTKLDGIATGATANDTNANLRDRATHTGTQAQSTVTGLTADLAIRLNFGAPQSLTNPQKTQAQANIGLVLSGGGLGSADLGKIPFYDTSGALTASSFLALNQGQDAYFVITTAAGNEGVFNPAFLTTGRNWFLPDADGTLALLSQINKTTIGLSNVENTALSTWAGATNLTTLGTVTTGNWTAAVISSTYGGTGMNNSALVADRYLYTTGTGTFGSGAITAAGRALIDDADATAQRTTLGLGGLATVTPGAGVATLLAGASTGTGGPVGSTSPTLTTPNIGAATGTSVTASGTVTGATVIADSHQFTASGTVGETASRNVASTDNGKDIVVTGTGSVVLTFPTGLAAGFRVRIINNTTGSGSVTIATSSTTINGASASVVVDRTLTATASWTSSNAYQISGHDTLRAVRLSLGALPGSDVTNRYHLYKKISAVGSPAGFGASLRGDATIGGFVTCYGDVAAFTGGPRVNGPAANGRAYAYAITSPEQSSYDAGPLTTFSNRRVVFACRIRSYSDGTGMTGRRSYVGMGSMTAGASSAITLGKMGLCLGGYSDYLQYYNGSTWTASALRWKNGSTLLQPDWDVQIISGGNTCTLQARAASNDDTAAWTTLLNYSGFSDGNGYGGGASAWTNILMATLVDNATFDAADLKNLLEVSYLCIADNGEPNS